MEEQYNYLFRTGGKYLYQLRTAQSVLNSFFFLSHLFYCLFVYFFLSCSVCCLVASFPDFLSIS